MKISVRKLPDISSTPQADYCIIQTHVRRGAEKRKASNLNALITLAKLDLVRHLTAGDVSKVVGKFTYLQD